MQLPSALGQYSCGHFYADIADIAFRQCRHFCEAPGEINLKESTRCLALEVNTLQKVPLKIVICFWIYAPLQT